MNKKYLLLISGIFVILVFIAFLFTLSSPQEKAPVPSNAPSFSPSPSIIIQSSSFISGSQSIRTTTAPENLTPEEVARNFYSWYLTYPGVSALSKGAYSTSIYLSDKFKRVISQMAPYSDNNDPVFCTRNKLANFTVLPATTTPDGRQSVIIQSVPQGKNLHKIKIKNINSRWVVDDTVCML